MNNRYPLRVRVTNQMVTYDHKKDKFYYRTDMTISTYIKRGYMVYDMSGRNIGIIYCCDGKEPSKGSCEFEFLASLRNEFGIWRIIKRNGEYFWFSQLEKILKAETEFVFTAD